MNIPLYGEFFHIEFGFYIIPFHFYKKIGLRKGINFYKKNTAFFHITWTQLYTHFFSPKAPNFCRGEKCPNPTKERSKNLNFVGDLMGL